MGVDIYTCCFCDENLNRGCFYFCENDECFDYLSPVMCKECRKSYKCRCEITDDEINELQKFQKQIDELTKEVNYFYLK